MDDGEEKCMSWEDGVMTRHAEASNRRKNFLEARKQRLTLHALYVEAVVLRSKQSRSRVSDQLDSLNNSLIAAAAAREARLAQLADKCGQRVARAKQVARAQKEMQLEEASSIASALVDRQQEAEHRRAALFDNKRAKRNSGVYRVLDRGTSATAIQRAWRRFRIKEAAMKFKLIGISSLTVEGKAFEELASLLQDQGTVEATEMICRQLNLEAKDMTLGAVCRTFLCIYMIMGHPEQILQDLNGKLQSSLRQSALMLAKYVESWLAGSTRHSTFLKLLNSTFYLQRLRSAWDRYVINFKAWKGEDAKVLVESLIKQYETVKGSTQRVVADEYKEAVRTNQLMLLSKLKKLCGKSTVPRLRRAIATARKEQNRKKGNGVSMANSEPEIQQPSNMVSEDFGGLGITNREIMHELQLDSNYQLQRRPIDGLEARINAIMSKAYGDHMVTEIKSGNESSVIPPIVNEIKTRTLRLLPPESNFGSRLSEILDIEFVKQQCAQHSYDYVQFIQFMISVLKQLCSPARDELVANISISETVDPVERFVAQLQHILSVLEVMGYDTANFHLQIAKPRLLQHATTYEQNLFEKDLTAGVINLEHTIEWLQTTADEMKNEMAARDPESVNHSSSVLSMPDVMNRALLLLITEPDKKPSIQLSQLATLHLDLLRFKTYARQASQIVTISALLLFSKNIHQSSGSTLPFNSNKLKCRLCTLLESETLHVENISSDLCDFIEPFKSPNRSGHLDGLIKQMTTKVINGNDSLLKLLKKRLYSLLLVHLKNTLKSNTAPFYFADSTLQSNGLGDLKLEIVQLADSTSRMIQINRMLYSKWYTQILVDNIL